MLEAKYYKDYNHNYLILKCENAEAKEHYQYHMLASDKIERVLKCSVRNINGAAYFYYDISSKVTLKNYYQGKKMTYEQVRDFFAQMDGIYQGMERFFMEERGLLMQPDSIYYDFTAGQYFGLYYPGENIDTENPYEELMDFLINHIDTENQKLVDIVYKIYELSGEQFFSWAQTVRMFENTGEDMDVSAIVADNVLEKESEMIAPSAYMEEKDTIEGEQERYSAYHRVGDAPKRTGKGTMFYPVFAAAALCGIVGTLWVYLHYELSPEEMTIVVCCLGVMGLCLVFSLIQTVLSGRKTREKEEGDRELIQDIEDEFREERAVSLQNVLDKNMDMAVAKGSPIKQPQTAENRQTPDYGETVFIDTKRQKMEYKLYALDKKNKKHIELTQFPFTIGKMAGCVDCVLADDSISRLHARIERRDEKVLLTDMNSMNGTYKNGLRMEPSETVEIEPGDEIRFGKLNYCYR
ncbi:MAG: FHA domain-containing protein [Bacillus sp. (in: Bacteria)]|nr:FHA domain-containing protein [Bacillus sp. (in: firmicutes)]MCM1426829.1 FHA domain-containing protein [Eubacterium sp.]